MSTHPWRPTALAFALALAFPAAAPAQSVEDLMKEIKALKDRVAELEARQKAAEAARPGKPQWGMTPEQAAEFNRIAVKTEALEDSRDALGFKGLKISGYMDPTYIYNRNQNRSGFQFLNRVDDDGYNYDNSYFGAASIDFLKETDSGTRWRLTLTPNRGVGAVFDGSSVVQEASVSVPLTDLQTRLIAGQVPDWSGYEYQQPTLNKLVTHNLLYDFTLPTAYTGAGVEITRGKWIVKAMLAQVNSSKNPSDEKGSALVYRVDYSKGEFSGFGFAGLHGKLANFRGFDDTQPDGIGLNPISGNPYDTHNTAANLFEFDAYFIRGDLTMQGQVSVGQHTKSAITADPVTGGLRDARWWGLSGLAAYKFTPQLEGIVRADYIDNKKNGGGLLGYSLADSRNGIGPGFTGDGTAQPDPDKGANRYALSLGVGYAFNLNTAFKAEYRYDHATERVFVDLKDGTFRKSNHLLGASVVVSF